MRCFSVMPVQKLHGDEGLAVLLADFVDGADVGMVQSGGGLRFALEARQRLRILGNIVGQELEGDKAMQPCVFGLVDNTHPAAAELLDDAVVRDGLADHLGQILRGCNVQVNQGSGWKKRTDPSMRDIGMFHQRPS